MELVKADWLTKSIGAAVLLTCVGLLTAPKLLALGRSKRVGMPNYFKSMQPKETVFAGAILSRCAALTSVGAGALSSVMLLYFCPLRMTPYRLVTTDIVHAIPLAVVAGRVHLVAEIVDGPMLLSLLASSIPAVIIASLVAAKFSSRGIQIALCAVLVLSAIKMLAA